MHHRPPSLRGPCVHPLPYTAAALNEVDRRIALFERLADCADAEAALEAADAIDAAEIAAGVAMGRDTADADLIRVTPTSERAAAFVRAGNVDTAPAPRTMGRTSEAWRALAAACPEVTTAPARIVRAAELEASAPGAFEQIAGIVKGAAGLAVIDTPAGWALIEPGACNEHATAALCGQSPAGLRFLRQCVAARRA